MSSSDQQTEKIDEREDGQLAGKSVAAREPQDVKDTPEKSAELEENSTATGDAAPADVKAPIESNTSATDTKENPLGITLARDLKAPEDMDTPESRRQIEDEATIHLAQRAADMSLDTQTDEAAETTTDHKASEALLDFQMQMMMLQQQNAKRRNMGQPDDLPDPAQRAAEMGVDTETSKSANTNAEKQDYMEQLNGEKLHMARQDPNDHYDYHPASPPPPPVPQKDDTPQPNKQKEKAANGSDSEEKATSEDSDGQEIPVALQGTAEQTGEEIQTIMHQFQEDAALGEQEIMSPRLEKQQPIFHLPPRTSSLENQEKSNEEPSPGIERRATETFFGSPAATKAPSIASPGPERKESADDNASITSRRTSLFQPPPPSPDPEPPAAFDFHKFLEQLRHRTADPVARYLRSFLQEFVKKQWAVHEQVKIIGDFLEFITKKMAQCEVWATLNDDEFDNAREGMEKLVMNRLYSQTFSPAIPAPTTHNTPRKGRSGRHAADAANPNGPGRRGQHEEDVERDAVIAQKMRIYGWIQPEHLDIQPVSGEKPQKFLKMAQQELLKINTYRAPRDKVICVLNTCKVLFGYLKSSKADQSADAFVPLLIYTVLRAAPEHLVSNVQYIWRFRNQDKLGGEAGYYMSSLMGVVTFIESLDRTSLTISDADFEHSVEQAVSAIAEGHRADERPQSSTAPVPGLHHLSEKSTPSRPEVTPRNSMDGERSSPRKSSSRHRPQQPPRQPSYQQQQQQQQQEKQQKQHQSNDTIYGTGMQDDEFDAVGGLLRSIQKPLSSIGRIFSDDGGERRERSEQQSEQRSKQQSDQRSKQRSRDRDRETPPPMPPRSTTSPYPANSTARQYTDEERAYARAEREALKRASVEAEEERKNRAREGRLVVE
jgi:hypothetical protein